MDIIARLDEINLKKAPVLGFVIWLLAFIYSTTIMLALGIDFSDADLEWGIGHEKYWLFEAIMTPSFLIFSILFLGWYYRRNIITSEQAITYGIIIMIIQFLLDLIVLVIILQSGFIYFYGLVTISYLTIPLWSYLAARLFVTQAT
jgi:hypothetical protein